MNDPNNYGMLIPKGRIIGCTTIDITSQDNGFLNCVRKAFPVATSNHSSTEEAVDNLLKCGALKVSVNIFGHGDDGRLITGTGQTINDRSKYMDNANIDAWEKYFKNLKGKIQNLYLFGCHPGAGDKGSDFLFNLARIVNATVAAPTGFFYCSPDHFRLEDKSTWQVATPTAKPSSISAPTPVHGLNFMKRFLLYRNNKLIQLSPDKVASIEIESKPNSAVYTRLTESEKRNFLSMVDFTSPIELPGIPASIVSGTFRMTIIDNGEEIKKEFILMNKRLVQDKEHVLIAYNCNPKIIEYFA